ncbi:MAG: isopentenyl-diphosphate delta-isomerase [Bacteriovoracaceae bacterium]
MNPKENLPLSDELATRKGAHIELAAQAQTSIHEIDERFNYEPLFFTHPNVDEKWEVKFLNTLFDYPLWISSMTGGTLHAANINQNLAKLVGKYNLGMGLGSCRSLLSGNERVQDFAVRKYLGDRPLYANLGIAQLEEIVFNDKIDDVHQMVKSLEATGIIIHLNPLQEWFQPEGDRYKVSPILTLTRFLEKTSYPVIVKEVGQGMGPKSLKALLDLPIVAIELAGFGGTNFSLLESLRGHENQGKKPFIQVGHSTREMITFLNALPTNNKEFIISGGIKNILDGYELKTKMKANSVIGMAQSYLIPAMQSFESLEQHFLSMREGLLVAKALLEVKGAN